MLQQGGRVGGRGSRMLTHRWLDVIGARLRFDGGTQMKEARVFSNLLPFLVIKGQNDVYFLRATYCNPRPFIKVPHYHQ